MSQLEAQLSQCLSQLAQILVIVSLPAAVTEVSEVSEEREGNPTPKPPPQKPDDEKYANQVWDGIASYFKHDKQKTTAVLLGQVKFHELTGIKQPYLNGRKQTYRDAERDWWQPLDRMLTEADGSHEIFASVLQEVLVVADSPDGFTISCPRSAVRTYNALLAKRSRGSPGKQPDDMSWLDEIPTFTDEGPET